MDEKSPDRIPLRGEPRWWGRFLETLERTGNVLLSSRSVGVGRSKIYTHRDRYPGFRKRWDDALENATDVMEAECRRRALNGIDKPIYYRGRKVAIEKEYSDILLMFLLKAHRPEKFRDNYDLGKLIATYTLERQDAIKSASGDKKGT